MSVTPNRGLPLMESSQAQPEVDFNAAMEILDVAESLEVEQSGDSPGVRGVTKMVFSGASVTDNGDGSVTVAIDGTSGGGGGGSLTVDALTDITQITFTGPAVSVSAGGTGEAVVTIDTVSGGSGGGEGNLTPDTHPSVPDDSDDEFEGASLDTGGTRRSGAKAWSTVNFTGSSTSQARGALTLTTDVNGSGSRAPRYVVQPLSGSAWKYRAKFQTIFNGSNTNVAGLALFESATGKSITFGVLANPAFSVTGLVYSSLSAFNTALFVTTYDTHDTLTTETAWRYWEIELASGTVHLRMSVTGLEGSFVELGTEAISSAFTTAPDGIGFYGETVSASKAAVLNAAWFRRIA